MNIVSPARLGAVLTLALALAAGHASAQEKVTKLFKVVTAKDEITIGFTEGALRAMGPGADIDNLAQRLVSAGEMTVWQYAVRRGTDGNTLQGPLRRIAIFKSDTLRIEPYNPAPLKVMPPDETAQ